MSRLAAPALFILCVALAASGCSKRRYKMPSSSMFPTILLGSYLTADTSAKGPARGEIWVMPYPENPDQSFVKRIVALPGDRVEMRGDSLVVNGTPVPSCEVGPYTYSADGAAHAGRLVMERSDGPPYLTFIEGGIPHSMTGPWVTAPGEVFVVGDNRNNSHDSRSWNGGLGAGAPEKALIGRVEAPPLALPPGADALAAEFAKCKAALGAGP